MEWLEGRGPDRRCPACHSTGPTHRVLRVKSALPPHADLELERCDDCGSAFFPGFVEPAYEDVWGGNAALSFYQEQGAGIDVMLASLYAVPHDGIASFLEIGCGFGFSVDFAARSLGWSARGIDPGPAARLGKELLGANIEAEYLSLDDGKPSESNDLMLCSEVIEHIVDPDPFLAVLAANLAKTGTVLLTTPNGMAVEPGASPATLAPLLSPGYHAILFSPEGLRRALMRAGFDAVEVADWGHTLRAAGARGTCDADFARPLDCAAYRAYLEELATRAEPGSPLAVGALGRLLKEFVNAGEYDACEPVLAKLRAALTSGWGLDLDAPGRMPLDGPLPGTLDDLHRVHPFNLTTVLYMTGTLAIVAKRYDEAQSRFAAAAKAADRIRSVLRAIGSDDGETEELGWRSRAGVISVAARREPERAPAAVDRFASEPSGPLGERAPARIVADLRRDVAIARRDAFVTFIGEGKYVQADRLAPAFDEAGAPSGPVGASATFAYGLLELNHRKSPKRALQRFSQARELLEAAETNHGPESFVWAIRFHEGLAALKSGDRNLGRDVLGPLIEPDPDYGTPGQDFADRARKLARDHGLIR